MLAGALVLAGVVPAHAAAPTISLSLHSTGSVSLDVSVSAPSDAGHQCVVFGGPAPGYLLSYGKLPNAALLDPDQPGLLMTLARAEDAMRQAGGPDSSPDDTIQVAIGGKRFIGIGSVDPGYRLSVTLSDGGQGGRFQATHLVDAAGGGAVDLSGSWHCDPGSEAATEAVAGPAAGGVEAAPAPSGTAQRAIATAMAATTSANASVLRRHEAVDKDAIAAAGLGTTPAGGAATGAQAGSEAAPAAGAPDGSAATPGQAAGGPATSGVAAGAAATGAAAAGGATAGETADRRATDETASAVPGRTAAPGARPDGAEQADAGPDRNPGAEADRPDRSEPGASLPGAGDRGAASRSPASRSPASRGHATILTAQATRPAAAREAARGGNGADSAAPAGEAAAPAGERPEAGILADAAGGMALVPRHGHRHARAGLPACTSTAALDAVSAALQGSPFGRIKALSIVQFHTVVTDASDARRVACRATVLLNDNTRHRAEYSFTDTGRKALVSVRIGRGDEAGLPPG